MVIVLDSVGKCKEFVNVVDGGVEMFLIYY